MRIVTKSEIDTFEVAKLFADRLNGGEVICLIGDLGAGKTAFTKGLAQGLGIKNIITSPTFVLMKVYETKKTKIKKLITLVHIDAYRLNNGEQLLEIGAEDYLADPNCITVIEWADRVRDIWPKKAFKIEFKILLGNKREIKITQK